MPKVRRKISTVLSEFQSEIKRLKRLDSINQSKFSLESGTPPSITKSQLHFLTESIFFRAYRSYECFVRDLFILYCLGKTTLSGESVTPFLKPKNFIHAEAMVQSSMHFLDWTNPETVVDRAELYLLNGFPFKLPYTLNLEALHDFRRIRNHIAHDSKESFNAYLAVVRKHYKTNPLTMPSPGEFLLAEETTTPRRYKLLAFFDLLLNLANDLT